ncbi:Rv3235 family protein [Nocardia sp. NPDC019395]|uniref:Rv3235 family protein n=1 Tax=Nocardia sp. NPDC019395 TaxID=3154686 RepID=UPI0033D7E27C
MRDFQPMLHRVPDFEPSAGQSGGAAPPRSRAAGLPAETPSARMQPRKADDGGALASAPDESGGAVRGAVTVTYAPRKAVAETPAGCRSRVGRRSLRANSSAPAGIRRAHRAAHAADTRPEPVDAREFAGKTLRILLEVLDRRRPVAQLSTLCVPALVHTIGALVAGDHIPSRMLGTAVLTKYRLFPVDDRAFELIAMYQRGPRRLALAGRVEYTITGWRATALRLT